MDPQDPRLARVRAPSLSDAMRKLRPHRAHVLDLVTPTPGRRLFGPAATLAFAPLRVDLDQESVHFERWLDRALGDAPAHKVLVAASGSVPDAAVAGGVRLAMLERRRVAGLLTDGRMRDFDEARTYSFAAYCRGETVFAGSAESIPVAAGIPVALGGATVLPGDYVYADDAGAVILPAGDVERALDLAVGIEAEDAERVKKARGA